MPNAAFMKKHNLSAELAAVVGADSLSRPQVVKGLWVYIKKHGLQDAVDKKMINNDEKMKAVFGKGKMDMFEMNRLLGAHLS
jgi:upstream activation factor subunit UAF30